ncbi:ABC transporter permease [Candidatus Methylacidiphilum fumarolicum]|uniref:ABC-type dipeptide/oligopeptide/nickel transport system, permease component n=2 Tax=Candidatus Methylacidiphilum fumarolicum TaxID=591154 RepID=I0JYL9_METFB|nr:ABC transporter permease [Candidatus Methylacidiphilum fumarolicum]MBW6415172.1 ABC transporter permease [Candidatus Methylacidiphilum fumarolicum]TFE65951.1 ABC transporter permease [Candidatus Methylacidiphilum fumarolicum]TFE72683.1 ABC transporter permease [Candidatus Methylacidiphilum fumarolicum]TFE73150.1 ABC transporter permease [Candidatus Methylacidiphilum fumarolicum]TFE77551.1 ABC transporter permease [Candidatus Methylacidiphilum fumarolicum]
MPPVRQKNCFGIKKGKNGFPFITFSLFFLLVLLSLIGPWFYPQSLYKTTNEILLPPSLQHIFGTDIHGRDLFIRILFGARISFGVGFSGSLISLFIGVAYGSIAAYAGGKIDRMMMQLVDLLYSLPVLVFVIVLIAIFENPLRTFLFHSHLESLLPYSRIILLLVGLGFVEWLTMARVVRSRVLILKESLFVQAAKVLGQNSFKILLKHIFPNIAGLVIVYLTLTIPTVILEESFLSFLGLGVEPPSSSLGSLLSDGANAINPVKISWWLLFFPGLYLSLTLWSLNVFGEWLRDKLDPKTR